MGPQASRSRACQRSRPISVVSRIRWRLLTGSVGNHRQSDVAARVEGEASECAQLTPGERLKSASSFARIILSERKREPRLRSSSTLR